MEVVAATFRRTSESDRFIPSQGPGRSVGPLSCAPVALTEPSVAARVTGYGRP